MLFIDYVKQNINKTDAEIVSGWNNLDRFTFKKAIYTLTGLYDMFDVSVVSTWTFSIKTAIENLKAQAELLEEPSKTVLKVQANALADFLNILSSIGVDFGLAKTRVQLDNLVSVLGQDSVNTLKSLGEHIVRPIVTEQDVIDTRQIIIDESSEILRKQDLNNYLVNTVTPLFNQMMDDNTKNVTDFINSLRAL